MGHGSAVSRVYDGEWRILPNFSANAVDTLHHDERARALGFRAGLVTGPTVAEAVVPAIMSAFGQSWFEGGWYDLRLVSPVYEDEPVRVLAEAEGDFGLAIRVETADGRTACLGSAGLGESVPWHPEADLTHGSEIAFPHFDMETPFPPVTTGIEVADYDRLCDAVGNASEWFRTASPWGRPIAPPVALFLKHLRSRPNPDPGPRVERSRINARFQLLVSSPTFLGEKYMWSGKLVDRGVAKRTWFWTSEFRVTDEQGALCALGRHTLKHLLK